MPRDGTGQYNLPDPPVVTNTVISSVDENDTRDDIAAALTGSVARDGQSTMEGPLPMGGFRITGLGDGTLATDAATFGQLASRRIGNVDLTAAQGGTIELPGGLSRVEIIFDGLSVANGAQVNLGLQVRCAGVWITGGSAYGQAGFQFDSSPTSALLNTAAASAYLGGLGTTTGSIFSGSISISGTDDLLLLSIETSFTLSSVGYRLLQTSTVIPVGAFDGVRLIQTSAARNFTAGRMIGNGVYSA